LHTNSKDEALALPTEEAVKIALRTQQILAYESGVTKTVDPVGGSYFIEYLTGKIEEEVYRYLKRIERMGGSLVAIEKGFFQDEIRKNAYKIKKEVDESKRIIVGVNKFVDESTAEPKIHVLDPEIEKRQIQRLQELKMTRDKGKVEQVLSRLEKAASSDENLMPFIIDAVKNYATLGEISNTFREVFGIYQPKISF
jgi:methylmalonyl-CoA mutase N-terminal domain/subunit